MGKRKLAGGAPDERAARRFRPDKPGDITGGRQTLPEEDSLSRFEPRVVQQQKWLKDAKQATALPVKTSEGGWQRNLQDVEESEAANRQTAAIDSIVNEAQTRREAKKQERLEAKLRAKKGQEKRLQRFKSPFLLTAQKEELEKSYANFLGSVASMQEIIAAIGEQVLAEPEVNLYRMELLMAGLDQLWRETERTGDIIKKTDTDESVHRIFLILFFSVGQVLRSILPGYQMLGIDTPHDGREGGSSRNGASQNKPGAADEVRLSREVKKLRKFESHLADLYYRFLTKFLFNMLGSGKWLYQGYQLLSNKLIDFVCEFTDTARLTNFSDLYLSRLIDAVFTIRIDSSADKSAARTNQAKLANVLGEVFESDQSLSLCSEVIPMAIKKIQSATQKGGLSQQTTRLAKKKGDPAGSEGSVSGALLCLKAIRRIGIQRKEAAAETEARRRGLRPGLDLSESRDKEERRLNKEILKEASVGLVHGDLRIFKKCKASILVELMTFIARVIRAPSNFPTELVFETLRCLSDHAVFVNMELMEEIFEELRKMANSYKQKSHVAGPTMLGATLAALDLLRACPNALPLDTDFSWIGNACSRATMATLPFIAAAGSEDEEAAVNAENEVEQQQQGGEKAKKKKTTRGKTQESTETATAPPLITPTRTSDSQPTNGNDVVARAALGGGSLTIYELQRVLLDCLAVKKAWGVSMPSLARITAPRPVLELFTQLCDVLPQCPAFMIPPLKDVLRALIGYYPGVRAAIDPEGILFSSLSPLLTIAPAVEKMEAASLSTALGKELRATAQLLRKLCGTGH